MKSVLEWLTDVHTNNSDIKFLPRFVIDGSVPENIELFLYDEQWQTSCAKLVVNFIKVTIFFDQFCVLS